MTLSRDSLPVLVNELDSYVFPVLTPADPSRVEEWRDFRVVGTSFLLSADGWIATCLHVVESLDSPWIGITHEGELHEAKVAGRNEHLDLALLKIDKEFNASPYLLGPGEPTVVGQSVGTLGFPLGPMTLATGNTLRVNLHVGFVSAIYNDSKRGNILWLDLTSNPGNSGSPLFDTRTGTILGMIHGEYVREIAQGVSVGTRIAIASTIGEFYPAIQQMGFRERLSLAPTSLEPKDIAKMRGE